MQAHSGKPKILIFSFWPEDFLTFCFGTATAYSLEN